MTGETWRRIKDVAGRALALAPDARAAFVAAAAGADEELRREVMSLLAAVDTAADLFEAPRLATGQALAVLSDVVDGPPLVGSRIGAYRILSEIGRGGMGAAYLAARDDRAYEKRVAIKLIKRGMDTDAILRRFRHERQILAHLDHPNIVTLMDGGTTTDGLPYFVMEYVDGIPIDRYCDTNRLPIPERLKLFQAVCAAVHHAHERRIVHRDLKPSNILVTNAGMPKLLDFGIAKLVAGGDAAEATLLERAMTPQYASPEQVRGDRLTASTDVYSLGALLYVLLTGRAPHTSDGRATAALERAVREDIPPLPSTVVDEAASHNRSQPLGELKRALRGNLDAIVMTALAKGPADRYPSAADMAADIARHLDGARVSVLAGGLPGRLRQAFRGRVGTRLLPRAAPRALAASIVVAAIAAGGAYLWTQQPPAVVTALTRSIAVLPFTNATGDPELDYVAEGLMEDLIARLSSGSDLKVVARQSASRYRGDPDLGAVRTELGVDTVVTGVLRRHQDRLRVSVELIDARDRTRMWGEDYDRTITEVQSVQRELAARVADRLKVRFSPEARTRFDQQHTSNGQAYRHYLRGRYFWNKRTELGFRTSLTHFTQAVRADPSFALAYAGLADAYGLLTEYHVMPAKETYPNARAAITKALELDPDLPEARTSLAYLRHFYEWDWSAAEQEYKSALALNPNYATAHQWYAELLAAMGRHDEALASIARAQELDPHSLIVDAVEALILYMAGRYDEAIEKCLKVIELDPNFPEVYEYLKRSYDQKGAYADAIAARQTRRRLLGGDVTVTRALRDAAAATSPHEYWRNRKAQELLEARNEGLQPYEFAEILAQTGDAAGALDWLERACAENDFMTVYIRVAPNLASLRGEARYQQLLQRRCGV